MSFLAYHALKKWCYFWKRMLTRSNLQDLICQFCFWKNKIYLMSQFFQKAVSLVGHSFPSMHRLRWLCFIQQLLESLDRKWQLCSTDPRVTLRILMMNITCWPHKASKNRSVVILCERRQFCPCMRSLPIVNGSLQWLQSDSILKLILFLRP